MGLGQAIRVQALLKGKPLADARVSFIPRGETLSEEFDERYERKTDGEGRASFTPTSGNYYLVVVHHVAPDEKGPDYVETHYSATLAVLVAGDLPVLRGVSRGNRWSSRRRPSTHRPTDRTPRRAGPCTG